MNNQIDITPKPVARQLFNRLVTHAGDDGVVDLPASIALAVELHEEGFTPQLNSSMADLKSQGWIAPHPAGGWQIQGVSQD